MSLPRDDKPHVVRWGDRWVAVYRLGQSPERIAAARRWAEAMNVRMPDVIRRTRRAVG